MTVDADFDRQIWIGVPGEWNETTWPDYRDWARQVADALWKGWTPAPGQMGPDHLALVLAMHAENPLLAAAYRRCFLWLPEPAAEPFPVFLEGYIADGDREQALQDMAGAHPDGAVEAPIVEEFVNAQLGAGIRVLRYSTDPERGNIILTLSYAWRTGESDILLWMSTTDTASALGALADIDDLARSVVLIDP